MRNETSESGESAPQPIREAQGYVADDYDLSTLDPADISMLPATFDGNYGPVGSEFTSHDWPEPLQRSWPWLHENMFFQDLVDDSVQFQPGVRARQPLQEQQLCHQTSCNMAESNVLCTDNRPGPSDRMSTVPVSSPVTMNILGTRQSGDGSTAALQTSCLQALVSEVLNPGASAIRNPDSRARFWAEQSRLVDMAFDKRDGAGLDRNRSPHLLERYVDLYFRHFYLLWPLCPHPRGGYQQIHPLFYLAMTSIGAMYDGPEDIYFGALLHEIMRSALMNSPLEMDDLDEDSLAVGQALISIQITALYFGHKNAFSFAQRLGGVLAAHARKIGLFTQIPSRVHPHSAPSENNARPRMCGCVLDETRKRLAFGIMRTEGYVSILLNTKPLVSYEELILDAPVPSATFTNKELNEEEYALAIHQERSKGTGMIYADLVSVALDHDELLPVLSPEGSETLLFGLQRAVWRFSHDPDLFKRLKIDIESEPAFEIDQPPRDDLFPQLLPGTCDRHDDPLDCRFRKLKDLRYDRRCLFQSLHKWKQFFSATQTSGQLKVDRSITLSSLLLYHLSFMRLRAPVGKLQQIAHHLDSSGGAKQTDIQDIYTWSRSAEARSALQHACAIWSMIKRETERPMADQARYNILTLLGLHYAAVIVWTCAGTGIQRAEGSDMMFEPRLMAGLDLSICRQNTRPLLQGFVTLFDKINTRGGLRSSFVAMANNMSNHQFSVGQC